MSVPERRAVAVIAAILGGRIIDPVLDTCPACGSSTSRTPAGQRTYCRACTLAELGVSWYTLALAREFGWSLKRTEAHLERHGPPFVNPKAWLTPRTKLRR